MMIKLIVPNCNRQTSPVVAYGKAIADISGGFTATQATGGWIDPSGLLIVEPVTVFDMIDSAPTELTLTSYRKLARLIARDLAQDCVYLSIDGIVSYLSA